MVRMGALRSGATMPAMPHALWLQIYPIAMTLFKYLSRGRDHHFVNFGHQNIKNMSLLKEFKEFVNRGNVMDPAVGVVIGGAFGKIVDSLVTDIISPMIGLIIGDRFRGPKPDLKEGRYECRREGDFPVTLNIGSFSSRLRLL